MTLDAFEYPDQETARICEALASDVRRAISSSIYGVASAGESLEEAKGQLGPFFGPWLRWKFSLSEQTARNYIRLHHLVKANPKVLEMRHLSLVYRLPSLPERVQEEIIEACPASLREANAIIDGHMVAEWEEGIDDLVKVDPGQAYHEIGRAMDRSKLREPAKKALVRHAETFAALSDRSIEELLQESNALHSLRTNNSRPAAAQLVDGYKVVVWLGDDVSEPITVAEFPRHSDPQGMAWRNAALLAVCERFGIG